MVRQLRVPHETCCSTGRASTRGDKQMLDHVRFTRELLGLRWRHPALRGQGFRVVHVHDQNRVLAFHRWVEGEGHDVMVVVHLSTFNRFGYRIGFPGGGEWREVFNSDVYENWVNPERRRQRRPRVRRAAAAARFRLLRRARAAGEQRPRVRAVTVATIAETRIKVGNRRPFPMMASRLPCAG